MKTLIALVVVQTAILIALSVRVYNLDSDNTQAQHAEPERVYVQSSSTQQPRPATAAGYTDVQQLREIIREELALALKDVRAVSGDANTTQTQALQPGPAYERRLEAVAQNVDYYVSVGRITPQEMSKLQMDIAQLNPEDRRAMMGAIVSAMNNGKLDGQL